MCNVGMIKFLNIGFEYKIVSFANSMSGLDIHLCFPYFNTLNIYLVSSSLVISIKLPLQLR